ncbi:TetR/AcrR family transcriptional regulator [Rhodospirillum sp. A1_3_36]|uniref:TetR/AcrR family transcriptional regulator n=1 Tax=Rhodospirillum sp. A1_3_36 TaxID=3391666 RepID=UPI0039A4FB5D
MQVRTKQTSRAGRPRKFDEAEALGKMSRHLWTTGLSGTSLDGIARSAGLNRPSLAAAFGDKNAIYAQAASSYAAMMDDQIGRALAADNLQSALLAAFELAIDIYTTEGPDGCFVICTAPADAQTNPVCSTVLNQSLEAIDTLFLRRLEKEQCGAASSHVDLAALAALLGATLNSLALRARANWSREKMRQLSIGAVNLVMTMLDHPP